MDENQRALIRWGLTAALTSMMVWGRYLDDENLKYVSERATDVIDAAEKVADELMSRMPTQTTT